MRVRECRGCGGILSLFLSFSLLLHCGRDDIEREEVGSIEVGEDELQLGDDVLEVGTPPPRSTETTMVRM